MDTLQFSVDAQLLRELGEKLVGKPHIAIAELVKNGYDADATEVTIKMYPENDLIEIHDNGHGMDFQDFKKLWMRIGSTHKEIQKFSKNFGRHLTGSKGVGRLSVQFLAKKMELRTTAENDLHKSVIATIEWEKAIQKDLLTKVEVNYKIEQKQKGDDLFKKGTTIILTGLRHEWKNEKFVLDLAKEIWWLQPPFRKIKPKSKTPELAKENVFDIVFESSDKQLTKEFNWQIHAAMDSWHAKIVGRCEKGKLNLALEFNGKKPQYYIEEFPGVQFNEVDFEIRIFHLEKRQPHGIKVEKAREYLRQFGGIHIYDGGFHLPYYGLKISDWLGIEHDHAMRSRITELLPDSLKFDNGGLSFLPNLQRIFGVVNVDTSKEDKDTGLRILITRDRLADNEAFHSLTRVIRWSMDLYANEEARRVSVEYEERSDIESSKVKFEKVEEVLEKHQEEIPQNVYQEIYSGVQTALKSVESEGEATIKRISLLGPLATAGISSLAYQHELKRQFRTIDDIILRIDSISTKDKEAEKLLLQVKEDLKKWVVGAKSTNTLLSYLSDSENIKTEKRFKAKIVINDIKDQVEILGRGIPIRTDRIDNSLLLPKATFPEWSSIFQNVFLNAFNALIDSKTKEIDVSSRVNGSYQEILVQDTGIGVDLSEAEELFKPFERRAQITPERQALGYGGTGLGLTIVNLVSTNIGCKVAFVKPEIGYKTAFSLKWREST